jgi:hypothetical protein
VAAYVRGLMEAAGLSQKEAIKVAARELGLPKREVYGEMVKADWLTG